MGSTTWRGKPLGPTCQWGTDPEIDPADYTCHTSCMALNGCQRCDEYPDWLCASACDAASCADGADCLLCS